MPITRALTSATPDTLGRILRQLGSPSLTTEFALRLYRVGVSVAAFADVVGRQRHRDGQTRQITDVIAQLKPGVRNDSLAVLTRRKLHAVGDAWKEPTDPPEIIPGRPIQFWRRAQITGRVWLATAQLLVLNVQFFDYRETSYRQLMCCTLNLCYSVVCEMHVTGDMCIVC